MRSLSHLFGPPDAPRQAPAGSPAEVEMVRGIIARLDMLPPDRARFVACAAYVVARAASADDRVGQRESAYMEQVLVTQTGLDAAEAALVIETAKLQALTTGGTDDYLVTREFRDVSTMDQRLDILRACFGVAAIDGTIDAAESFTIDEIALELDLEPAALAKLRGEFADRFSAVQSLKADLAAPAASGDQASGDQAPAEPATPAAS
jgi:tellurite resistance protein